MTACGRLHMRWAVCYPATSTCYSKLKEACRHLLVKRRTGSGQPNRQPQVKVMKLWWEWDTVSGSKPKEKRGGKNDRRAATPAPRRFKLFLFGVQKKTQTCQTDCWAQTGISFRRADSSPGPLLWWMWRDTWTSVTMTIQTKVASSRSRAPRCVKGSCTSSLHTIHQTLLMLLRRCTSESAVLLVTDRQRNVTLTREGRLSSTPPRQRQVHYCRSAEHHLLVLADLLGVLPQNSLG